MWIVGFLWNLTKEMIMKISELLEMDMSAAIDLLIENSDEWELRAVNNKDIWRDRFFWLIEQHWVEGEVTDNLGISYQCADEYEAAIIAEIDSRIKE